MTRKLKRVFARRVERFIALSAAVATGLSGLLTPALAATQTWNPDANGTAVGGSWDNNTTTFWNGTWVPNSDAVFGGSATTAPYVVTLTDTSVLPGPIVANSLQFSTAGYILQQAAVLPTTLSLTTGNITVDPAVDASINNNVWTPASAQAINKFGAGSLILTGSSPSRPEFHRGHEARGTPL